MSKEDKIARNVVTLTFMLVMVVMFLLMSSCSTYMPCAGVDGGRGVKTCGR